MHSYSCESPNHNHGDEDRPTTEADALRRLIAMVETRIAELDAVTEAPAEEAR